MQETILDIKPNFNERWPRDGFCFVPTFMLYEGDRLHFDWNPVVGTRTLKIEIEKTDYKADLSPNKKNLIKIELEGNYTFVVQERGLYTIPIENPKSEERTIGQLLIVREFNGNIIQQRSPYPERFYTYAFENENGKQIKKCLDWGYLTDRGACIVEQFDGHIESFRKLYDSTKNDFHFVRASNTIIEKILFFEVKEGDEVVVELTRKELPSFYVNVEFEKKDRVGFWGRIDKWSKFRSNEDSIVLLKASISSFIHGFEGVLPTDFCEIKLYGKETTKLLDFDTEYELVEVYNTVFNREEPEPIKRSVAHKGFASGDVKRKP